MSHDPSSPSDRADMAWDEPLICEIPLTRGLVALVSPEDYEELAQFTWHAAVGRPGRTAYAARGAKRPDYGTIYMHRVITGVRAPLLVDHVNGNGLDNRRTNLRACTNAQNLAAAPRRIGTSGYRGVSRSGARFGAWGIVDGRRTILGSFDTPHEAALAYDRAAIANYGSFAVLNFPKDGGSR